MLTGLFSDLKTAGRVVAKSPAFALTVILTLALTVALSTVVFSVLEAVLLRPLPYNGVDRIVSLVTYSPQGYTQPASYPEYLDWRRDARSFDVLAAYNAFKSVNFEWNSSALPLDSVATSDNFFDIFQVKPVLGRTFRPGEEQEGSNRVVVLSNEVWRTVFNAKREAIGAAVKIDGRAYTVIGVMPPAFRFPIGRLNAVYFPLNMDPLQRTLRGNHWLPTIGRLKTGVPQDRATAELNSVLNALAQVYPDTEGRRAKLLDLATFAVGKSSDTLRLLMVAVLVLLTIGCVNIAGLISARGIRMEREMAVRSALGAGRVRLIRQFLLETLIHGLTGGVLGIAMAFALLQLIRTLLVASLNRGSEIKVNLTVLSIALAVSVLTALLAGLMPAVRLSATSANLALRSGGRSGTDRQQHRVRAGFATIQIALALMLLMTAGILFQALAGLRNRDLGFKPEQILTTDIEISPASYEKRNVMSNFYTPLLERVQAMPEVTSAGLIQILPIQSWGWNSDVQIAGQPPARPNQERLAEYRLVTPGFYSVFENQLLRGRLFNARLDLPTSQRVTVVNETFVKRFIPAAEDPIGKAVMDGTAHVFIVGVVRDLRQDILQSPLAEMDIPVSQIPAEIQLPYLTSMHLVMRTKGKPELLAGPLRQVLHQIDKSIPFRAPETMNEIVAGALTFQRLENWLFGSFAALAVLLALIGLYGLISEEVQSSTRDIGVRMALGATRARIFRLVYSRVGAILIPGVVAGLLGVYAARTLIAATIATSLEGGTAAAAFVTAGFALIALIASSIPARQAATIDPMKSLRDS